MSHNRKKRNLSECLGLTISETRGCKIDESGKREPGAWRMEPENQHPETGAARVRSDPSCAGQAREGAGSNILIDVTLELVDPPFLPQQVQANKINREVYVISVRVSICINIYVLCQYKCDIIANTIQQAIKKRNLIKCLGFGRYENQDCEVNGSENWELGAWKMEPKTEYPETGAARVRSDPSCAGQAG